MIALNDNGLVLKQHQERLKHLTGCFSDVSWLQFDIKCFGMSQACIPREWMLSNQKSVIQWDHLSEPAQWSWKSQMTKLVNGNWHSRKKIHCWLLFVLPWGWLEVHWQLLWIFDVVLQIRFPLLRIHPESSTPHTCMCKKIWKSDARMRLTPINHNFNSKLYWIAFLYILIPKIYYYTYTLFFMF